MPGMCTYTLICMHMCHTHKHTWKEPRMSPVPVIFSVSLQHRQRSVILLLTFQSTNQKKKNEGLERRSLLWGCYTVLCSLIPDHIRIPYRKPSHLTKELRLAVLCELHLKEQLLQCSSRGLKKEWLLDGWNDGDRE